jgi:serine/threonine-protein kinase
VQNLVMAMIAKKPADRPSSAATVSRAAQALRRGDLNSAAIAVPAIAGVGVADADDATRILTGTGDGQATSILPTTAQLPTGQADAEEESKKKKRSPWTWPLVALIALLVIALGGTLLGLLLNQDDKKPVDKTSSSAPATTPVSTPTETTPTTVDVDALNLKGMTCDEATKVLTQNGLVPDCQAGNPAASQAEQGKIYEVIDGGNQKEGATIRLTYYADQTQIPAPASAPSIPGTLTEGQEATVSWNAYVCPSGTDQLSSYEVTITNAKFQDGKTVSSFTPGTGSAVIVVDAGTAGKTVTATYRAFCGERPSGMSGSGTSTGIQAAAVDPGEGVTPPPVN